MSGAKIIDGLNDALAYAREEKTAARVRNVRVPDSIDVKAVRDKLRMSQSEFAMQFGIPLATVRNWEQGRRRPEAMARVLLQIINNDPDVVEKLLAVG
ncbi:NadS family protein [Aureimonas mangrovi]|uniref:NadS family protein n=1 Tax=Aureimonas mangrovi TaxID=2758041 RepID=UPI00163D4309|nr:NadS family protein [Aureimonas mangrovi]